MKCKVDVCDRNVGRNPYQLCSGHHKRHLEGRSLDTPLRRLKSNSLCEKDNCTSRHYAKGLCRKHYDLQRNVNLIRYCKHCEVEFKPNTHNRQYCEICSPPLDAHAKVILRQYGLSKPEWVEMYNQQHGLCALSSCDNEATDVDHCHATGKIRKLLCRRCNVQLGHMEDLRWITSAMKYLRDHDSNIFAAQMVEYKLLENGNLEV